MKERLKNRENAADGNTFYLSEGRLRAVIAEILLTCPADVPLYRTAVAVLESLEQNKPPTSLGERF